MLVNVVMYTMARFRSSGLASAAAIPEVILVKTPQLLPCILRFGKSVPASLLACKDGRLRNSMSILLSARATIQIPKAPKDADFTLAQGFPNIGGFLQFRKISSCWCGPAVNFICSFVTVCGLWLTCCLT